MAIVNGVTDQPVYAIPTDNSTYVTKALLTVGDEVPVLKGDFGSYTVDPSKKYAMAGIPDGLGLYETSQYYYVFMNHEIADGKFSNLNSTTPDKINGARVSVFQFTKDWKVVGGKNLIESVVDNANGKTYTLNTTTGLYGNSSDLLSGVGALSRFCSSFLAQHGFVDPATGQATPMYFGPEESGSPVNRGWAITADGVAYSLDVLGRYAKENIVAAINYRPLSPNNTSDKTVLLVTEDFGNGELYMWVGNQTQADPNGFKEGQLYVLQVSNPTTGAVYAYETMPEDVPLVAKWTPISKELALGTPGQTPGEVTENLSDWVDGVGTDGKPRSTNFRRLEDIAEDPTSPGTFYFNITGNGDKIPGTNIVDNPYGTIYRISLNGADPAAEGVATLVHIGGPQNGVSFDNLTVLDNGVVLTQEDRAYPPNELGGGDIYADENRQAYIWEYNPITDQVIPQFELDQSTDPTSERGAWESSGIIQVGNKDQVLFNVQAHTIKDPKFVEGGQLLIATQTVVAPADVFGTPGNDDFDSVVHDKFIGDNQQLFASSGNDTIDVSQALGGNRIDAGSGDDLIFAGTNNRILAGSGADRIFLGYPGGNNVVTGGSGADQFWLVTDEGDLPTKANTITDFTIGADVIGFAGTSLNFAALDITQIGSNTIINALGRDLAVLQNVQASLLTASNFVFA
jgi:glycerophosphoryl diester phosphodiesterase